MDGTGKALLANLYNRVSLYNQILGSVKLARKRLRPALPPMILSIATAALPSHVLCCMTRACYIWPALIIPLWSGLGGRKPYVPHVVCTPYGWDNNLRQRSIECLAEPTESWTLQPRLSPSITALCWVFSRHMVRLWQLPRNCLSRNEVRNPFLSLWEFNGDWLGNETSIRPYSNTLCMNLCQDHFVAMGVDGVEDPQMTSTSRLNKIAC